MSVFCPKCGMKTFNEYTCDHCQHTIKKEKVLKKNWQPPKNNIRITSNSKSTTTNKNPLLIIAIGIITISLAYIAYSKYQERKWMEELVGTTDPKEFKQKLNQEIQKQLDEQNKAFKEIKKTYKKTLETINKNQIVFNNINRKFTQKTKQTTTKQIIKNNNQNIFTDGTYWKLQNANNRMKRILIQNHIDYNTILKQRLHNQTGLKSGVLPSRKKLEIENRVLKELISMNGLKVK